MSRNHSDIPGTGGHPSDRMSFLYIRKVIRRRQWDSKSPPKGGRNKADDKVRRCNNVIPNFDVNIVKKWKKLVFLYNFCVMIYINRYWESCMRRESSKVIWKNIILLGIPVIIAVLSVFCGLLVETAKEWFGVCLAGIVLSGFFYIGAVIYYAKEEKNRESKILEYDRERSEMEDKYQNAQLKNEILSYIVATYKETIRGYC